MNTHNCFIIFTDAPCIFCNRVVQFLIKRDKKNVFRFSFFGSDFSKKYIEKYPDLRKTTSVLMISPEGNIYKKTDCIIKILTLLGGGWRLINILRLIPRFIRNSLYTLLAKNRYRLLGRNNQCHLSLEFPNRFYK